MPKYSANLSMLYTELPFLERFGAAAQDGFPAVEYLGPYDHWPEEVAETLARHGLKQALFNVPSGDWANGERGIASLPDRTDEFRAGVDKALTYAKALACPKVNCLAGIPKGVEREAAESTLVANLRYAAETFADAGVKLLLEPINQRDIPGFFVSTTSHAERIMAAVGSDNLHLQYDFYHMQIMQGDLIETYKRLATRIAHVQIADNPGRNEPGTGEINYRSILKMLDATGYDGYVGCEYRPLTITREGLGWMKTVLA